jgi:hypothetical protein
MRSFRVLIPGARGLIDAGVSPAFGWSGGIHTQVSVPHRLGVVPLYVIPSSARYGDALGDDARTPWLVTVGPLRSDSFDLLFNTKNNAVIGVFSVPAGACSWIAVA